MNEFLSAIGGAVVGAVIAGTISFLLQRQLLLEGRAQRSAEIKENKKALAFSIFYKLVRIHTNFHVFSHHLEEPFRRHMGAATPQPWQIVLPLANMVAPVDFSSAEMSMLLDLKNNELFQEVVSLDAVHNATIKSFETHRDLTSMLRDQIGPNSEVDGEGFIIDDEHIRAAQHLIVSINKLVTELRTQCAADAATSFAALKAFTTLINDSFDLSLSVELKEPAHVAE